MNKHLLPALLLLLLAVLPLRAEYFRHIGLSDGLTQPSVMAIFQDRLGRMWFGTREGINRYDGTRVTPFKGWSGQPGAPSSVWLGNEVSSIVEDRQGNLLFLIDEELVQYNLHTEQFTRVSGPAHVKAIAAQAGDIWYMQHDSLFRYREAAPPEFTLKTGISAVVNTLTVLPDCFCIGTLDGAYLIGRKDGRQRHLLPGKDIFQFFESSTHELWIGTRMYGLYRMKPGEEPRQVPYQPGSPHGISSWQIRAFTEDNDGNVWFGTFNGLHKYNPDTGEYALIQIPQYIGGLNHPSIYSLFRDRQGTVWIGSYYGGVNYFQPKEDSAVHYDYDKSAAQGLYYSYIGDIVEDKEGRIWMGTDGGGVCCTDQQWNTVRQLTAGGADGLLHNNIKSIAYDPDNDCLYIGAYLGGLSRYDLRTRKLHNYLTHPNGEEDAPGNYVYHVQMWEGHLYISAREGVFRLDPQTDRFERIDLPAAYYVFFDIDEEGNLYLSRYDSILRFSLRQPGTPTVIPLTGKASGSSITRIRAVPTGCFITTSGAGLYYYERATDSLHHFTAATDGLPSDYCYNIYLSPTRQLYITTDKGVTQYAPEEDRFFTISLKNHPIINGCGLYINAQGRIYVGDTRGMTVVNENDFRKTLQERELPLPYLTQLRINNQEVKAGDTSGVLDRAFAFTHELDLAHDQNNVVFGFALADYTQRFSHRTFRYRLEGFDKDWVETDQPEAHYTNLPPGRYRFQVGISLPQGPAAGHTVSLPVRIHAPWYATWWAFCLYLAVFSGCVLYFIYNRIAKRTLALSLEKERFEKQQIERLNQEKLVFFTNVSHEFRTPLTLIISHIDLLLQKPSLSPVVYNQVLKIRKNACQLNNLITELLEFRKLTQHHKELQVAQQDILNFVKENYLSFVDQARLRNITYTFDQPDTPVLCWFDASLMERVFSNLISNAFKYTPDGGSIRLSGRQTGEEVEISIADTGIGIAEQELTKIFQRFFQGHNPQAFTPSSSGTGIGLALTKSIVERHHGHIRVESVPDKGSVFTVVLPAGATPFENDPMARFVTLAATPSVVPGSLPPVAGAAADEAEESVPQPLSLLSTTGDEKYTLLLVEDNADLLQVLKELFAPFYQLLCASNGEEGIQQVREHSVDLIISDVMMPVMSGTEMCLQLKNHIDYCHIPIILLTALNTPQQSIEGLSRGADDYITKPFHAQLLLARANNLIRSRLLLQHRFDKQPLSEIDLTSINPLDKDLLKRTSDIIERHLDDTRFGIPVLCEELGIGRSLLYAKFKALTGMTPNNFLLNYRLKQAAVLLKQPTGISIAEVSDRCGFSTPVYFSQCFKKQYGMTPQAYRKQQVTAPE